jgi:hypothetical protein
MFKKIIKSTAIACATLIALSATGCSDTSWAVKVDNVKIPAGVYVSYLYINRENVLYQASQSSSSASSNTLTGAASSSSDPWSQKIDTQTAYNWAINSALKSTEELAMTEELCTKKKITLTAAENTNLASYASQYMTQYTGFASNGVSQASFEKYFSFYALVPKLIDAYYGKGGETPVSDTDLKNYYTGNYADIKQIYLTAVDANGTALPDDQQSTIKAQADQIFAGLNADKTKFAALQTQYDQDVTGQKNNPAGYIFAKDSNILPPTSVATAFTMKVGDVQEVPDVDGWHIIYKVAIDTSDSVYTDTMKEQVLQEMKTGDLIKLIDDNLAKAKVVKNEAAINHYNPKNLKDK